MKAPPNMPINKVMYLSELTEKEIRACDDEFLLTVSANMTLDQIQALPLYISQRILPLRRIQ